MSHSQYGIGDSLRSCAPLTDTICIEKEFDGLKEVKAIHIHCIHDTVPNNLIIYK